ncbi:MAG TPA: hypothetical protein VL173_08430 [Vicinamibacterales bacterium]|nr:hypothetical protein [Vicinamibacterales bacterium]
MTPLPGTGARSRRFLFVMHYPGYLRYFDSTIRALVARGHHIDLVFDSPDKQAEGVEAVADIAQGVEVLGRMPTRRDLWATMTRGVRGAVDYLRYRHPDFRDTPYLRDRMRSALPGLLAFLDRKPTTSPQNVRRWVRFLQTCERAIPNYPAIEEFIASRRPDAVLVTPLVTDCSPQVDVVKSAQARGIPAALCVASWDHLTTKGLIRVEPDLVALWNDAQRAEALEYHAIPNDRIVVTGAQPFDKWFERTPTSRASFCAKVGLRADRPFVLFVGSTASISAPGAELAFVRRWIEALRRQPALRDVGILVRPHPYNIGHWATASFPEFDNVSIYPRRANPVNEPDRQDYFDSLYHSETVVGVNTTAMIEAAIVGRTVHSVLGDEFRDTQGGTLHFRYLLAENGGFLVVAHDLEEHARNVVETLRTPDVGHAACARFVARFIRPQGIDVPSTPLLATALERLAAAGPRPRVATPLPLYPLRAALWLTGFVAVYRSPTRSWNSIRKQAAMLKKRVKHARKNKHARKKPFVARAGQPDQT